MLLKSSELSKKCILLLLLQSLSCGGSALAKASQADLNKVKSMVFAGDGKAVQFVRDKINQGKDVNEWNEVMALIGLHHGHMEVGDGFFNAARAAARSEPSNPRALATFALVLAMLQKNDVALQLSQKTLELDPKNARALAAQAFVLGSQGSESDLAKEIMGKAVKLSPHDRDVNFMAYKFYEKILEDLQAEEALTRIIKDYPNDATALYQRAWLYKDLRDRKKSIEDCKKALAINPDYENALGLLARMLHHNENWKEALAAYNRMEEMGKKRGRTTFGAVNHGRRAECFAALGQNKKAIEDYTQTLKLISPEKSDATFSKAALHMNKKGKEGYIGWWTARAQQYAKTGNVDRAIKDLSGLLAVFPNNPTGLHERVKQLQKAGKYEQALKDINSLIAIDADVALWYRIKVDILKKMGRTAEAQKVEKQSNSLERFGIK